MSYNKKDNFTIKVHVKPNSKYNSVNFDKDTACYVIKIKSPPIKGKANKKIIKLVKEFFKADSCSIVTGITSTTKTLAIYGGIKPGK